MSGVPADEVLAQHDAAAVAGAEAMAQGRFGLALHLFEESRGHAESLGERRKIHAAQLNVSSCYLSLGDWARAKDGLAAIILVYVVIGWRCLRAVLDPIPAHVQMAVKHAIMSLIVIDAALCWSVRGMGWAVVILLLLVPAMFLGRWIYST